jgi:hypothetical protein
MELCVWSEEIYPSIKIPILKVLIHALKMPAGIKILTNTCAYEQVLPVHPRTCIEVIGIK